MNDLDTLRAYTLQLMMPVGTVAGDLTAKI